MSLGSSAFTILIFDYRWRDSAAITLDTLNVIVTIPIMIFSFTLIIRNGIKSIFGKSWIFFTTFTLCWFIADTLWTVYELIYKIDPFPSEADYFWLVGYPFYFVFTYFYLKPFKSSISQKLVIFSIIIAAVLLSVSLLYVTNTSNSSSMSSLEILLGVFYPVGDTIALIPIIIGLGLFFRGEVNFLWSLLFVGMLCFVVADLGFLIFSLDDSYYTGHPIDIPYLWGYIFFVFGVYSHLQIFKKRNQEDRFNDQEDLR